MHTTQSGYVTERSRRMLQTTPQQRKGIKLHWSLGNDEVPLELCLIFGALGNVYK